MNSLAFNMLVNCKEGITAIPFTYSSYDCEEIEAALYKNDKIADNLYVVIRHVLQQNKLIIHRALAIENGNTLYFNMIPNLTIFDTTKMNLDKILKWIDDAIYTAIDAIKKERIAMNKDSKIDNLEKNNYLIDFRHSTFYRYENVSPAGDTALYPTFIAAKRAGII